MAAEEYYNIFKSQCRISYNGKLGGSSDDASKAVTPQQKENDNAVDEGEFERLLREAAEEYGDEDDDMDGNKEMGGGIAERYVQ